MLRGRKDANGNFIRDVRIVHYDFLPYKKTFFVLKTSGLVTGSLFLWCVDLVLLEKTFGRT